jgi:hypothetical protein
MQYGIDFQYMAKGDSRPTDDGQIVGISASDASGVVILPQVGDFVQIDNSTDGGQRSSFSGKVRSRLFSYVRISDEEVHCGINIVVEETDDNWGELIKE